MRKLIVTTLLLVSCSLVFGQLPFLEKQKGIKKIETYSIKYENKEPSKELKYTEYYNPDGTLEKKEYRRGSTIKYFYEKDLVIEVSKYDDCISAYDYQITKEGENIIYTKKEHQGKYKPENNCGMYAEDPDVIRPANGNDLFPNVVRRREIEEGVRSVFVIKYTEENSTKEYELSYFERTKYGRGDNLISIQRRVRVSEEVFLHQTFRLDRYRSKNLLLYYQQLKDEYGAQVLYMEEKELYVPSGEEKNRWAYEVDKKGNWTKKYFGTATPADAVLERKIKYYK